MQLVTLFGSTRDAWMAADLEGWLAPNRIYPGVADAMRALMAAHEVDIVTTKQARFTHAILRQMAGIDFPLERIYSQTVSGRPKSEVLEALQEKNPGAECHFVEDKLSTLEKVRAAAGAGGACALRALVHRSDRCDAAQVAKLDDMAHWNLYLVDWGYNTAAERERAGANSRIRVINRAEFAELAGSSASL